MKKIALIMMITALSVFMLAAVVSADGNGWKNFHGVYEMTAKANGLHSTWGFSDGPPYRPSTVDPDPSDEETASRVWGSADVAYGTWKFFRNGKGTAEGMNYAFDFPPGGPFFDGPIARNNPFYLEFDYDITRKGDITVTVTNLFFELNMTGKISQDRKTMTLYNAYTKIGPTAIFMASRVLIRVK